jgi:hypothetical protein
MRCAYLLLAGLAVAGCSTSKPSYNPTLPFTQAGPASFVVADNLIPEKAVGLDQPGDYLAVPSYYYAQPTYQPGVSPMASALGTAIGVAIVAAIDQGIDNARNDKVSKFLADHNFDAKKVFYDALTADLAKSGHSLNVYPETDKASVSGTALKLNIGITHYGYQITTGAWAPSAMAYVSVTTGDGSRTLLRDSLRVGAPPSVLGRLQYGEGTGGDMIVLPYNPAYVMVNEDAITQGDPNVALDGLTFALQSLARGVADMVRQEVLPAASPADATTAAAASR